MNVGMVRRVVCASLISVSVLETQPAVAATTSYDSEASAEAACLESFKEMNSPGSENRRLLERSPTFSATLLDKWLQDSLARQTTDGRFCYGYRVSLLGTGGTGWSWIKSNPCQQSYDPRFPNPPTRDLTLFPIRVAAPRLTALHMVKGGSANGDMPMFGGIFTPHIVYFVSFEIASDQGFNNVVYSVRNSPRVFNAACWYPDRIDMANKGKSDLYLASIWSAAANWDSVNGIPGWIKGDYWLRVTVAAPGLGSDSIVGSVFFPDGHGFSRYEQPRQSPSVVEIAVSGDSLSTKIVGSMDPYRELTICVWTRSGATQRNNKCVSLKQESNAPQVGSPTTYNFNWRDMTRSDPNSELVKLTVSASNAYGSDLMEFTVEQSEEFAPSTTSTTAPSTTSTTAPSTTSTTAIGPQIVCRRGTTVRRFKAESCPTGWRRSPRP